MGWIGCYVNFAVGDLSFEGMQRIWGGCILYREDGYQKAISGAIWYHAPMSPVHTLKQAEDSGESKTRRIMARLLTDLHAMGYKDNKVRC